jgi:hypothetical protein
MIQFYSTYAKAAMDIIDCHDAESNGLLMRLVVKRRQRPMVSVIVQAFELARWEPTQELRR